MKNETSDKPPLPVFDVLYAAMELDLHRIAGNTRGEITVDDLKSDTWILVTELQNDGTSDATLLSPESRQYILGYLYNRYHKFFSKRLRYAISLNYTDDENDDGENSWLNSLVASPNDDPLEHLCQIEEKQEQENKIKASFSEAAGYLKLLENFESNRSAVAAHLALSWSWLWRKIKRARDRVEKQGSLFDGIEIISDHFMPPPGRSKRKKPLSRSEHAILKREKRRLQRNLFVRAYIPIKVFQQGVCIFHT